nr:hypothetical protein [Tanacetum cinerariifolium]
DDVSDPDPLAFAGAPSHPPVDVARREKRIQDRELEIKNLEVRLETEAEMKRAVEDKNAELVRELEDIR